MTEVNQVLELFKEYQKENLNDFIDYGDISDGCIRGCIQLSINMADEEGKEIADRLLRLSKKQRQKVLDHISG